MHKLVDKIPNRRPKTRKKNIEIIIARENDDVIKESKRSETKSSYEHIYPFLALTIITMGILMIAIFPSFTGFFDYQTEVSSITINRTLMPGSSLDLKDINITNITSLKITGTHELDDDVKIILIWQESRSVVYDSDKYRENSITGFSIVNISENKSEDRNLTSNNLNISISEENNSNKNNTINQNITTNLEQNKYHNRTTQFNSSTTEEREDYQKENETNKIEYSLTKTVNFKKVCLDTCHLKYVVGSGRIVIKSKRPVFIEKIIFNKNKVINKKKEEGSIIINVPDINMTTKEQVVINSRFYITDKENNLSYNITTEEGIKLNVSNNTIIIHANKSGNWTLQLEAKTNKEHIKTNNFTINVRDPSSRKKPTRYKDIEDKRAILTHINEFKDKISYKQFDKIITYSEQVNKKEKGGLVENDKTSPNIKKIEIRNNKGLKATIDTRFNNLTTPKLTLSRWNDETNIDIGFLEGNISNITTSGNRTNISFDNRTIIITTKNIDDRLEGGGIEFDLILQEKPPSNKFEFEMNSENLEFFYQPPLFEEAGLKTPTEECSATRCRGRFRPKDVVGSYAVYHKSKKDNEYKTGKAFHIYRPKIFDNEGEWIWGELKIDEKKNKLTITADNDWLQDAEYPVIIDPTFGYTTAGASSEDANDYMLGYNFSTAGANVSSISMYLNFTKGSGNGNYIMALYYANNNSRINETSTGTILSTQIGWQTANFSADLISSGYYNLAGGGIAGSGGSLYAFYDSGDSNQGGSQSWSFLLNGGHTPDPWNPTQNSNKYSIYATYTPTGNAPPDDPTPTVNSTDGTNRTSQDLYCLDVLNDYNNDSMNVTVRWYKNNTLNRTDFYNNTYANGTAFNAKLLSGNTSVNDFWNCSMRLDDGDATSGWGTSDNITILEPDLAPTVTLNSPTNDSKDSDGNITINCTAKDDFEVQNVSLYGNWSGWGLKETTSGSLGKDYDAIFNVSNLTEGNYKWNCLVQDNNSQNNWGTSNFTFEVRQNSLLSIDDNNDNANQTDEQIIIYANYTNKTSGDEIKSLRLIGSIGDIDSDDKTYSTAFFDYNNDSERDEFLIGSRQSDRGLIAYWSNGTEIWNNADFDGDINKIKVTDINKDYTDEIIYISQGSTKSGIFVLERNGSQIWNFTESGGDYNDFVLADLNNDGYQDIAIIMKGYIKAFNNSGSVLWNRSIKTGTWILQSEITKGDLDGDGLSEDIIGIEYNATSEMGYAFAIKGTDGSILYNITVNCSATAIETIDLDNDSYNDEVLIGCYNNGVIYSFEWNGTTGANYSSSDAVWMNTHSTEYITEISSIDLDNDGTKSEFVSTDGDSNGIINISIRGFGNNSDNRWNYSDEQPKQEIYSLRVGDLNGDGEEEIVMGSKDDSGSADPMEGLYYLNRSGSLISKYAIDKGGAGLASTKNSGIDSVRGLNSPAQRIIISSEEGYAHIFEANPCRVRFNDSDTWYIMRWNISANQYQFNKSFSTGGTYSYSVDCYANTNGYDHLIENGILNIHGTNQAPDNPYPRINSTSGSNKTNQDLNCYDTITDPDGDAINVTVRWYRNNTLNRTDFYNNTYTNGTAFNSKLLSGNTTKEENWLCSMRLDDGSATSAWINSSSITIINDIPEKPSIIYPLNSTMSNRYPNFNWTTRTDLDNDQIHYEMNVTPPSGLGCFGFNDNSVTESNRTSTVELCTQLDYSSGSYSWQVRACDDSDCSEWTTAWFNITSVNSISLTQDSVSFGSLDPGTTVDTTSNSPEPINIRNDGNIRINVTARATDYLFDLYQDLDSEHFQFRTGIEETDSFNFTESVTDWTNVTNTSKNLISSLLYLNASDEAEIEIRIEVPWAEPPGDKQSSLIIESIVDNPA